MNSKNQLSYKHSQIQLYKIKVYAQYWNYPHQIQSKWRTSQLPPLGLSASLAAWSKLHLAIVYRSTSPTSTDWQYGLAPQPYYRVPQPSPPSASGQSCINYRKVIMNCRGLATYQTTCIRPQDIDKHLIGHTASLSD